MDMCKKRELRKNKKMEKSEKSLPSTSINWVTHIFGNSQLNHWKIRV